MKARSDVILDKIVSTSTTFVFNCKEVSYCKYQAEGNEVKAPLTKSLLQSIAILMMFECFEALFVKSVQHRSKDGLIRHIEKRSNIMRYNLRYSIGS